MTDLSTIFDEAKPQAPARVIDRSTAERYAKCPLSARLSGDESNALMDAGTEVHNVIAEAVYQRSEFALRPGELRELMADLADKSRPDVQPDVVAIIRKASWIVIEACCFDGPDQRSSDDLIRYDGGKGERSGQLATDVQVDGETIRITGEIDLMLATPSASEVKVNDWKSGWTWWTPTDVRSSFQFQWYAYLVFRNFPTVATVSVSVFMLREGVATDPVQFRRKDMNVYHARIISAMRLLLANERRELAEVPAWPDPDKCGNCAASYRCLHANKEIRDAAAEPETFLAEYIVVQAKAKRMKDALSAHVRKTGKSVARDGWAFGPDKPKQERQPACGLYEIKEGVE